MATTRAHRAHVLMLLGKLRHGKNLFINHKDLEAALGYPLIEADATTLRGVIAALETVVVADRPVTR